MVKRLIHRLPAFALLIAAALAMASAFAQVTIMVNDGLVMDDDLQTMLDTGSGGLLSADEYSFFKDRLFDQNDANHDHAISAQEYADHAKAVFADMDANGDGYLTKDEITTAHMNMLRMMYKNPHAPGVEELSDAMLSRMDTDHDGRISAQEYADAMKARFDEIDANHDGAISKKEFDAAHHQHKG